MRPETTTTSGKSGGTSSRSSGKSSNAGQRSVRQAEYTVITSHGDANHQDIQMLVHKADIQDWSTEVHDAVLSATFNWREPPGINDLLRAVLPTWAKVGAYIDVSRLAHVDIHKDRSHLTKKEGALLNVGAGTKTPSNVRAGTRTPLSCRDRRWGRGGSAIDSIIIWSTLVSSCRPGRRRSRVYRKVSRDRSNRREHAHGYGYLFRGIS